MTTGQNSPDTTVQFAGLTNHNRRDMTDRAARVAGIDPDDPPETSLTSAIRDLETAESSGLAWEVPEPAGSKVDPATLTEDAPDGVRFFEGPDGGTFVKTDRYQSIVSPEKVREYVKGSCTDDDGEYQDALWNVPTKDYSVVNPLTAYEPLEEAIRDEDLGDEVFGEIRQYKNGGEVHADILFDNYRIDYNDDDDEPIILGIRTGYDFFGGTALYFEGYAQDRRCSNSIRSITEQKTIRHVGEVDLEDEVQEVLEELGLMTNQLAELIELAEEIEVDLVEVGFSGPFDHDDNLRALYELLDFPSYLAREAASHARSRADNQFLPDMTDVWDGATYALSHAFRGGENTSRAQELIDAANDMVMNPSLTLDRAEQSFRRRMGSQSEEVGEQEALNGESAAAEIAEFSESVQEKAEKFESRNEELRQALVEEANA